MSIIDRIRRLFGLAPRARAARGEDGGMISCEDALRRVQEYLDGELRGVSHEQVRAHFEVCERCWPYLRFEESFREAVRRAGAGEAAPEGLRLRVTELIAEARSGG